ncbi:gamma-glutamyltransferase 1, Threonine peptidase, MEROPS family T03 [Psychromonas ingrahamii 37]|uniref:Glutathione hydrolase proenzyme n=1 Tax=Psychromonas ingrahamii (strain DSM 17664 / CCUG 51855 / 37) TaxID=357804 RepID=A1SXB5_PSYIN|nr:gamma-glutamyltransferase [Psychromonas ingrahamii]ABM04130.1 gamma-glutamyltransferase 1, Threonine peptidase, MEROPS family T03 [Psychromonas ingrahamii 37]
MNKNLLLCTGVALLSLNVFASPQVADTVAPETATSYKQKTSVVANQYMVAAAHPLAVEAGYQVLKNGGNAADALVAVQTVLGLVEPQSSGFGGGAFLVYYDAKLKVLTTFDGRETAPLAAKPELFQDSDGKPLKFYDAVVGGRSVGTPGTVKLLATLHDKYGSKKWSELFQPAQKLANNGFTVSERLASSIEKDKARLSRYPDTKAYFFTKNGEPLSEGSLLKNKKYAETLSVIAEHGEKAFYQGQIAKDIVNKVTGITDNPGVLAQEDFSTYKIIERKAVCAPYHQYSVCGMGPPSSGALTIGQILGIASHFDLKKLGADSPEAWQIIGDASRLAFADRGRYMADSDFVPMPEGLLNSDYLAGRAKLIQPGKALSEVSAGNPPWKNAIARADDQSIEFPSTTHIVITDKEGNTLSMTSTVENGFGSRVMSNGFILNNELTDFSFASYKDGYPIANRVEPGKRPRSSMSPSIIMEDGKPYMALGSPGGSRIIGYVASTIIAHLDWGMGIQQAIDLPHLVNRFGTYDIEQDTKAIRFKEALEMMGYEVNIRDLNSGLHAILFKDGKLIGGADPRREGIALGD